MNTITEFSILSKQFHLRRFPMQHKHSSLQAWDAADEYLLKYVNEHSLINGPPIAIINDDFGALACMLSEYSPMIYSDSFMAHSAITLNCERNQLPSPQLYSSLDLAGKLNSAFDTVIIKIPKTLALLEQQLFDLRKNIGVHTTVIAGAKVKMVTSNVLKLFEKYIGKTSTSLAVKKSRLIFASFDPELSPRQPPLSVIDEPSLGFSLHNHANVFSRKQLDIGARLLLEHLPSAFVGKCIDLGCGNGVLGIKLILQNPKAKVTFIDESFMALASAKLNAKSALAPTTFDHQTHFEIGHCLQSPSEEANKPVDLVLCNPPFHQQNVITEQIAEQMFVDAKGALKMGGELRIVANRHLPYYDKLKRLFGSCKLIANNRKFVVLSATKHNA